MLSNHKLIVYGRIVTRVVLAVVKTQLSAPFDVYLCLQRHAALHCVRMRRGNDEAHIDLRNSATCEARDCEAWGCELCAQAARTSCPASRQISFTKKPTYGMLSSSGLQKEPEPSDGEPNTSPQNVLP